jgi:hypothetical protein
VSKKRAWGAIAAGLLLLILTLPQSALAAGPMILNVSVPYITSTTANITWITNTTSNSQVHYGTAIPPGQFTSDSYNVFNHTIVLTGLTPGTKYYFEVQSTDATGTATDNSGGTYYYFVTPGGYSIILASICGTCGQGVCGEVIGVTAVVAAAGTYHICWDALTAASVKATFKADKPGPYTPEFFLPEATKGIHRVYLTDSTYVERARAEFEVLPSVKISPEQGPEGTAVSLNGYGFAASQGVQIKFDSAVIATPTANSVGSWNATYTMLGAPGGGHTFDIEAQEGTLWVNWAGKYFKVTPKITVTGESGKVGQAIDIKGTGFASKEKNIKITLGGELWTEISAAQENGSWTVTVPVPAVRRGEYEIVASGMSTRARDVPPVKFTVNAGISVDRVSAYVGDTVAVQGGGFAAGETGIRVYLDGQPVSHTTITADTNGCWESSFGLLTSAYGPHTVSASGDSTQSVVTSLNTLARIIEISPDRGAPGDLVSLTGDGFGNSKQLTVTIGGIAASENMVTLSNGNVVVSFHVPKGSMEGTRMLVATDVSGASDSWDFTVTNKTLSVTLLPISPKGSRLSSGAVTFRWQGMPSGGDITYTYTLEISQAAGSAPIWSKSGLLASNYTLTDTPIVTETLPPGTYYWRVKIADNYGNESPWSDSSSFNVFLIPTWLWVVIGVVILIVLMVVAYRETKFKIAE